VEGSEDFIQMIILNQQTKSFPTLQNVEIFRLMIARIGQNNLYYINFIVINNSVNKRSAAHPEFFIGDGADPEVIYNLCLMFRLCYKNHVNITVI
jgi:hypothetical protein